MNINKKLLEDYLKEVIKDDSKVLSYTEIEMESTIFVKCLESKYYISLFDLISFVYSKVSV